MLLALGGTRGYIGDDAQPSEGLAASSESAASVVRSSLSPSGVKSYSRARWFTPSGRDLFCATWPASLSSVTSLWLEDILLAPVTASRGRLPAGDTGQKRVVLMSGTGSTEDRSQAVIARFGQAMRASRRARQWSLADLAEKMELSQAHCHNLETGFSSLKVAQLIRIGELLDLPLSEILFADETAPRSWEPCAGRFRRTKSAA